MKDRNETDGIVLIDKSKDVSSADSLNIIKKRCNIRSIGHAGTLDPFATGLLIACTGKATKMISYFQDLPKAYEASLQLGAKTNTYDTEGDITDYSNKKVTLEDIKRILPSFKGKINQTPPLFSAIKVNGKRAYELARQNIEFSLKSRYIQIQELSIISFDELNQQLKLHIECSKGTYIRSLAYDIGEELGCFAYVLELTRVKIGKYHVRDAMLDMMIEDDHIVPVTQFFKGIPQFKIKSQVLKKVLNGAPIEPSFIIKDTVLDTDQYIPSYYSIYSLTGVFIAIVDNQTHKPFYIDAHALQVLS